MKTIFTSLFLFTVLFCSAQPTLTYANVGLMAGDMFTINTISNWSDPGAAGADVTWDFYGLTGGTESDLSLVTSASTPYGDDFPNANLAIATPPIYGYVKSDATSYSTSGIHNGAILIYYDNPEDVLQYPVDYMDENIDDLHSSYSSGISIERYGNVTMTADGWGTLILPTGVYTDVLRVHLVEVYSDDFGKGSMDYAGDTYMYWTPGVHYPLLTINSLSMNGLIITEITTYITSIEDNISENVASGFRVFPNPAENMATIVGLNGASELSILDASGREVEKFRIATDQLSFDVSHFDPGLYCVAARFENVVRIERLLVK